MRCARGMQEAQSGKQNEHKTAQLAEDEGQVARLEAKVAQYREQMAAPMAGQLAAAELARIQELQVRLARACGPIVCDCPAKDRYAPLLTILYEQLPLRRVAYMTRGIYAVRVGCHLWRLCEAARMCCDHKQWLIGQPSMSAEACCGVPFGACVQCRSSHALVRLCCASQKRLSVRASALCPRPRVCCSCCARFAVSARWLGLPVTPRLCTLVGAVTEHAQPPICAYHIFVGKWTSWQPGLTRTALSHASTYIRSAC